MLCLSSVIFFCEIALSDLKINSFEAQVLKGLKSCKIDLKEIAASKGVLGAAVSGGADSVSLLISLSELCRLYKIPLKIITVNHNIREERETCGDVKFVEKLCETLKVQNYDISLAVYELERGEVVTLAEKTKIGIEAAARELRYDSFEKFIAKEKLSCLCLAHNKNDQLETLLMRFLQGAGTDSSGGIPPVRGKFVRPLLGIERAQIEKYLVDKKISWRIDSTNNDSSYLRNRIRNELVPLLNDRFCGWDNAVLNGAQKAIDDCFVLEKNALDLLQISDSADSSDSKNEIFIDKSFYLQPRAIKIRALLLAANKAGFNMRIPYLFLRDVCDCADNNIKNNTVKNFANLQIILKNNGVLIKKTPQIQNEIVFSAIIEKSGLYEVPAGQVFVPQEIDFPVLLRNARMEDEIETACGGTKKVKDIFADWHIPLEMRQFIPVVQDLIKPEQKIVCILGKSLGYKDWIVKNEKM